MPGRAPKKLKVVKKSKNRHPVLEKLEKGTSKNTSGHHIKSRKYMKYSKTKESQNCTFIHSLSSQLGTGTEEL